MKFPIGVKSKVAADRWEHFKKMSNNGKARTVNSIAFISIVPFLLMTFIITWGILALFIFLPEPMNRIFGQLSGNHPLFFLAVWAPA